MKKFNVMVMHCFANKVEVEANKRGCWRKGQRDWQNNRSLKTVRKDRVFCDI